jgi:hypothetical protein
MFALFAFTSHLMCPSHTNILRSHISSLKHLPSVRIIACMGQTHPAGFIPRTPMPTLSKDDHVHVPSTCRSCIDTSRCTFCGGILDVAKWSTHAGQRKCLQCWEWSGCWSAIIILSSLLLWISCYWAESCLKCAANIMCA